MKSKQKETDDRLVKNSLIATFMGGVYNPKWQTFTFENPVTHNLYERLDFELDYHYNWNTLIPAARECYKRSLHQGFSKVNCIDYCLNGRDFLYEEKIAFDTVWNEVVSWIEWYNQQKMNEEKKTTMDEVMKMMKSPMNQLPKPAQEYLRHLSSIVGFCGEVCITAYAAYCQAVLGLPCDDEGYKIRPDALQWFKDNKYC